MSLKESLNAALTAFGNEQNNQTKTLDEDNWASLTFAIPPQVIALTNAQLRIDVALAESGNFFTLLTPLAALTSKPKLDFYEILLSRQSFADQTKGLSYALEPRNQAVVLLGVYHWTLDSITPEQFRSLVKNFTTGAFELIRQVAEIAKNEPNLKTVHP